MITGLFGVVMQVDSDGTAHLRCGPVTLEASMPLSQARELAVGSEAEIYTYLHFSVTASQLKLFGFTSAGARDLFTLLITASGIGPRVALALLELGVPGLATAVRDADENALTSVPGVGPKLAKKLILELKDKVAKEFAWAAAGDAAVYTSREPQAVSDALDAIVALGYPRLKAEQALAALWRDRGAALGEADAADLVRGILQRLASG